MNQNLLIVDDELEILTWLQEMFCYDFNEEIGVYTANSALEALELLNHVKFDVVLTDISMPGMDGIALFKHIKDNWTKCKIVFLTGYRNFDDVYQIINNKDVQYILKSEDDDVIMDAVRNSLKWCKQELEQERYEKLWPGWKEEANHWLKKEFMNQLCEGNIPEDLDSRMQELGISLNAKEEVLLILLRVEKNRDDNQVQEQFLIEKATTQILQENLPPKITSFIHVKDNNTELLFVQPKEFENIDWKTISAITQGAVEYTQERLRTLYNATISAIVLPQPIDFSNIMVALSMMKKYLVGYIGGAREVILKIDSEGIQSLDQNLPFSFSSVTSLKNMIEMHKKQEYFLLLKKILWDMTNKTSIHDTLALEIYYGVSILLLQFINENHLNEQLAFQIGIYKLTRAEEHKNWMEAAEYITKMSEAIFDLMDKNENNLTDRALNRVVNYIEDNLEKELSLNALADIGGFNASYLSRLFKQLKKETISDFILHKRIGLAKELLTDTNVKIQEVAAKVGYLSSRSFTRAFHNEVGISPTEYRELNISNKK